MELRKKHYIEESPNTWLRFGAARVVGNSHPEQSARCEQRRQVRKTLGTQELKTKVGDFWVSSGGNTRGATAKSLPECKAVLV